MQMFNRTRWPLPEILLGIVMLILVLAGIGIDNTPGSHDLANFVAGTLFFGLMMLWIYINNAAVLRAEKRAKAGEKDHTPGEATHE